MTGMCLLKYTLLAPHRVTSLNATASAPGGALECVTPPSRNARGHTTVKFSSSQLAYLIGNREARGNLRTLLKYLLTLLALITLYAVLFHVIKGRVEGEQHSWITGFYWTLVVMTTLGFGDITFTSDIGRLFSIVVLLSGRRPAAGDAAVHVHQPVLRAVARGARPAARAARRARGHARPRDHHRVRRHRRRPGRAAAHRAHPVLRDRAGSDGGRANDRRGHLGRHRRQRQQRHLSTDQTPVPPACSWPTAKTPPTPTSRSRRARSRPTLPIAAIAEEEDSIDVLQLSGATTVLPLKRQLGEYLANRVHTGAQRRARDRRLSRPADRGASGARHGPRRPDGPRHPSAGDEPASASSVSGSAASCGRRFRIPSIQPDRVIVLAGTEAQIAALDALMPGDGQQPPPVLIIGAGKVGQAAARALEAEGHRGPRHRSQRAALEPMRDDVVAAFAGDAADRRVLEQRRHPPRVVGAAHDQRRCDEHLPGGVLPPAEPVAAHRQPHHARAQRRSDSPRRRRLRAELHDARRRGRRVAAARLRAGGARGRRGAVLDSGARRR